MRVFGWLDRKDLEGIAWTFVMLLFIAAVCFCDVPKKTATTSKPTSAPNTAPREEGERP